MPARFHHRSLIRLGIRLPLSQSPAISSRENPIQSERLARAEKPAPLAGTRRWLPASSPGHPELLQSARGRPPSLAASSEFGEIHPAHIGTGRPRDSFEPRSAATRRWRDLLAPPP